MGPDWLDFDVFQHSKYHVRLQVMLYQIWCEYEFPTGEKQPYGNHKHDTLSFFKLLKKKILASEIFLNCRIEPEALSVHSIKT